MSTSETCNGMFVEGVCGDSKECCVPSDPAPTEGEETGDDGLDDDEDDEIDQDVIPDAEVQADPDLKESLSLLDAAGDNEVTLDKRAPAKKKTKGDLIYAAAARWLGQPYVWGGGDCKGPTKGGFDCSGLFLHAVCKVTKKKLYHQAKVQYKTRQCRRIPRSKAQRGDAVFWGRNGCKGKVYHVAILKDKNTIIHASGKKYPLRVQKIYTKNICPYAVRCW